MSAKPDRDSILSAITTRTEALRRAGLVVLARDVEDVDMEEIEVSIAGDRLSGLARFTSGGSGNIQLSLRPGSEVILDEYLENASASQLESAMLRLLDRALAAAAGAPPPLSTFASQYVQWVRSAAHQDILPKSGWVLDGSIKTAPDIREETQLPWARSVFIHRGQPGSIWLTVYADGRAIIERANTKHSQQVTVSEQTVSSAEDFLPLYREAMNHTLKLGDHGPSPPPLSSSSREENHPHSNDSLAYLVKRIFSWIRRG